MVSLTLRYHLKIKAWYVYIFNLLKFVSVNSAYMYRYNKDMKCNDSVNVVTDFIYRLS